MISSLQWWLLFLLLRRSQLENEMIIFRNLDFNTPILLEEVSYYEKTLMQINAN